MEKYNNVPHDFYFIYQFLFIFIKYSSNLSGKIKLEQLFQQKKWIKKNTYNFTKFYKILYKILQNSF